MILLLHYKGAPKRIWKEKYSRSWMMGVRLQSPLKVLVQYSNNWRNFCQHSLSNFSWRKVINRQVNLVPRSKIRGHFFEFSCLLWREVTEQWMIRNVTLKLSKRLTQCHTYITTLISHPPLYLGLIDCGSINLLMYNLESNANQESS